MAKLESDGLQTETLSGDIAALMGVLGLRFAILCYYRKSPQSYQTIQTGLSKPLGKTAETPPVAADVTLRQPM